MCSERKHGLSTEPVPVSALVGSSKTLKDLKDEVAIPVTVLHINVRTVIQQQLYRGALFIRNSQPLGPYSRTTRRALWL